VDDEVFAVASVPADATAAVTAEAAIATTAAASHHLRFKVFIYGPSFLLRRGRNLDGGEPSPRGLPLICISGGRGLTSCQRMKGLRRNDAVVDGAAK